MHVGGAITDTDAVGSLCGMENIWGEDLLSRDAVLMYCSIPEREPEHFRHFKIAGSFMESMEQWCSSHGLSAAPELAIHVRLYGQV